VEEGGQHALLKDPASLAHVRHRAKRGQLNRF